jgi:hypothetical protein
MDNIINQTNRASHVHPDRDMDIAMVVDTNKKVRGSRSLEFLRDRLAVMEMLLHKWENIYGYSKLHNGGQVSSNNHVMMAISKSIYLINQRIKKIELQNRQKSRLQGLRYKTAREIESLVQDGTVTKMRLEIQQLQATVARDRVAAKSKEPTPEDIAAGHAELKRIKDAGEAERNELREQGNEMAKLFGVRAIDTGKAELDTDIDTFMKEV